MLWEYLEKMWKIDFYSQNILLTMFNSFFLIIGYGMQYKLQPFDHHPALLSTHIHIPTPTFYFTGSTAVDAYNP